MQGIRTKLQDKKSFTYMAYKVIKSKVFSSILLFISSIILIRHLPKEDFGLYVLMIAFFALFEIFMGGFDASLVRFIPTIGKIKQHKLIATIFSIKTMITLISLVSLYFVFGYSITLLNIPDNKIELYQSIYLFMSIIFIFKYIITTNLNIITSYMLYDISFKLSLYNGIFVLLSSIIVSYLELGLTEYISLLILSNFIIMSMGLIYISQSKKLSSRVLIKQMKLDNFTYIFKQYILSYSTPLLGVSILSYIKNYLPTYIFGTMVSLETLAVYSIFKKITDFLHKGYAGIIQGLYPKLFKMMHSKSKAIDKLFWIGLIVRVLISIVLFLGYDFILSLYNIQNSSLNNVIFLLLIGIFLIMSFQTLLNLILLFDKKTFHLFKISFIRTVVSVMLMILLYKLFGVLGVLVAMFLEVLISTSYMFSIIKYSNNPPNVIVIFYRIYILLVVVVALLILYKGVEYVWN